MITSDAEGAITKIELLMEAENITGGNLDRIREKADATPAFHGNKDTLAAINKLLAKHGAQTASGILPSRFSSNDDVPF